VYGTELTEVGVGMPSTLGLHLVPIVGCKLDYISDLLCRLWTNDGGWLCGDWLIGIVGLGPFGIEPIVWNCNVVLATDLDERRTQARHIELR